MIDSLPLNGKSLDKDKLVKLLVNREMLGSTVTGIGVVIPLKGVVGSFGRSLKGIDFRAEQG